MEREHDIAKERITITRCRQILGREADELSDADVERIGRHAELMAHAVIEMFLEQHAAQK